MKSFLRNLKGVLAMGTCAFSTIACFIPIMLLALLKLVLPFMPIRAQVTRWIMAIGSFWVDVNALIFGAANSTRWDIRGVEGLSTRKWYLVISNHQTWVDIVVLQTLFNHRIPFLKFFIKQQLIWFPFLGLAWWAMDMPFMKRNSKSYLARHPEKIGRDLEETRKACEKFKTTPTSVINFIEGTRFTTEKKSRRGSGFVHLLPPRAGGVALALSSMGEMFDAILDVTLVYPEMPPPKFWEMYCGEFRSVIVNVQQRPVEDWMSAGDYTNDRDYRRRFHQWLAEIWQEKDMLIGTLRSDATG